MYFNFHRKKEKMTKWKLLLDFFKTKMSERGTDEFPFIIKISEDAFTRLRLAKFRPPETVTHISLKTKMFPSLTRLLADWNSEQLSQEHLKHQKELLIGMRQLIGKLTLHHAADATEIDSILEILQGLPMHCWRVIPHLEPTPAFNHPAVKKWMEVVEKDAHILLECKKNSRIRQAVEVSEEVTAVAIQPEQVVNRAPRSGNQDAQIVLEDAATATIVLQEGTAEIAVVEELQNAGINKQNQKKKRAGKKRAPKELIDLQANKNGPNLVVQEAAPSPSKRQCSQTAASAASKQPPESGDDDDEQLPESDEEKISEIIIDEKTKKTLRDLNEKLADIGKIDALVPIKHLRDILRNDPESQETSDMILTVNDLETGLLRTKLRSKVASGKLLFNLERNLKKRARQLAEDHFRGEMQMQTSTINNYVRLYKLVREFPLLLAVQIAPSSLWNSNMKVLTRELGKNRAAWQPRNNPRDAKEELPISWILGKTLRE